MRQAEHPENLNIPVNVVSLSNAQPTSNACPSHRFPDDSSVLRSKVLAWLAENVPQSRLAHILRVEELAIALAEQYDLPVAKAAQAGLMHDLAKYFPTHKLLEMADREGLVLDPVDQANPHLLHAEVGAIVAREQFGIRDEQVLNAIRNHTLGHPTMDSLSCVVFLADSLEPGRGDTAELQHLRELSRVDLAAAVWQTCDYTLRYLLAKQQLIHPRAIATRNAFLQMAKRKPKVNRDSDRGNHA